MLCWLRLVMPGYARLCLYTLSQFWHELPLNEAFWHTFDKKASILCFTMDAAVHSVMVTIVCILDMYNSKYAMASCVSEVYIVNQCGLWCCWA